MRGKIIRLSATVLAFVFALSYFQVSAYAAQESGFPEGVVGITWQLREIQRSPGDVLDTTNVNITLRFDGQGMAAGDSTCNTFSASYQTGAGQALTLSSIISTLRACVDTAQQDLETEYYRALEGVKSYSFDGANLELMYGDGGALRFWLAATSGPAPGMPTTGAGGGDYIAWLGVGLLALLLGAGLSRRGVSV